MNKLILLIVVFILGCTAWAVDAPVTTPVAPLPTTKVNPKDSADMVLVQAGEFVMGITDEEYATLHKSDPGVWFADEVPQHKVKLDAYYIYKTEVTVAQYRKFCVDTKREMPPEVPWKWKEENPISNVNWDDAKAYADWAGVSLPTEAQWEKAARGEDGRNYPWGNEWDKTKCNNDDVNPHGLPSAVGSYPTGLSPYGALDMAGNVWEWCADWYDSNYYKSSPKKNPTGPENGNTRVLRGASFNWKNPNNFRTTFRHKGNTRLYNTGFRCVFNLPVP